MISDLLLGDPPTRFTPELIKALGYISQFYTEFLNEIYRKHERK